MNKSRNRLLIISVAAFIFYTLIDIASGPLWMKDGVFDAVAYAHYYLIWQVALLGFLVIIAFSYHNILVPLAIAFMSLNGTEDFLYFMLQGQPIPSTLPWLDGAPLVFPHPAVPLSLYFGVLWGSLFLLFAVRRSRKGNLI